MKHKTLKRLLLLATLAASICGQSQAGYVEAGDVQKTDANPSPTRTESNINNYLFQDEQVNVSPSDGELRILRTNQKNLVNDYVTEQIPILNASPRELRNVMRQVTGLEGGRAEVIRDKKTKQNFLQVIAPAYMIPYLREAVAALDVPWLREYFNGSTDIYYKLQHRGPDIVNLIASRYSSGQGFSRIDRTNNAIRRLDEIPIAKLWTDAAIMADIPANQVLLEVKVYELNNTNDLKLGLDYINWKNGPGRNLWTFSEAGYSAEQRANGRTSGFDPFLDAYVPVLTEGKELVLDTAANESYRAVNYLLTSNYVDFLQAKGKARLLKNENILVISSRRGVISAEDQVVALTSAVNSISPSAVMTTADLYREKTGGKSFLDANGNGQNDEGEERLAKLLLTAVAGKDISKLSFDIDGDGKLSTTETGMQTSLNNGNTSGFLAAARQTMAGKGATASAGASMQGHTRIILAATNGLSDNRTLNYQSAGTVGLRMAVTPYVGLESMVLDIDLNASDLNGLVPSTGLPIINRRTLNTSVRLLDGQPYVIATLSRDRDVRTSAKAPWIGDLPALGYLFGGETQLKRNNDVVVTITPHFILSKQKDIELHPRVDTLGLIVEKDLPAVGLPKLEFGFDQWLIGS